MSGKVKLNQNNIADVLGLTPVQEGILFHYLHSPDCGQYFGQLALDISGELDIDIFQQAWSLVVETNEMLRTVFRWDKLENPVQIVLKRSHINTGYRDLSGLPADELDVLVEDIKTRDRRQGFDLEEVPFRAALFKLGPRRYTMVVSSHHIIYDGWSNGVILRDFFAAYDSRRKGRPFKPVSRPKFKEFVQWLRSRETIKDEAFWKGYLEGFDGESILPRLGGSEDGVCGSAEESLNIEKDLELRLEEFALAHKITLSTLMYGAWGILLQRYTNTCDTMFGTTVSGRHADIRGVDDVVGLFINTVPLRVKVHHGQKTADFLAVLYQSLQMRNQYEHAALPEIALWARPGGQPGKNGLFNTIVVIENYPVDRYLRRKEGSLILESYRMVEATNYDITLFVHVGEEGIVLKYCYNRPAFDRDAIQAVSGHFLNILMRLVEHPGRLISDIEILTEPEKNRILYGFNDTFRDMPANKTLIELFRERADSTPGHISVCCGYHSLTFGELDRWSHLLAGSLLKQGISIYSIAGVLMERSAELIVGIIGILKTGAAYLPLDPRMPDKRINLILEDSKAHLLLTDISDRSDSIKCGLFFVKNRSTGGRFDINCRNPIEPPSLPCVGNFHTPAYVIYTSGTTGKPKGVIVEHGALVNFIIGIKAEIPLDRNDVILSLTAVSFDIFGLEVFLPLAAGFRMVVGKSEEMMDASAAAFLLQREKVTILQLTPSRLQHFITDSDFAGCLGFLKYLLVGGEFFARGLVQEVKRIAGGRVFNLYGPSETTIWSTLEEVTDKDASTIGRPIANTVALILNRLGPVQPVGQAGELVIGGFGVARGYLNRPELTASKFIDCGAWFPRYKRMYRTGDIARWMTDGNLEFVGRSDDQVKIRGARVDPGEIEDCLLKCAGITKAAVVAYRDRSGDIYLCGYYISDGEVNQENLKSCLGCELPEYMIPRIFYRVDHMPLTLSGKVDRRALPIPDSGQGISESRIVPANSQEKIMAGIWSDVLGVDIDKISVRDNFFDLGGHSLKATRLAALIHRKFHTKISVSQVFDNPTIETLTGCVEEMSSAGECENESFIPLQEVEKREYYYLHPVQRRLFVLNRLNPGSTAYNLPIVMSIEGEFSRERAEKAIKQLVRRHESLRTSFLMMEGEPVQRICSTVPLSIEMENGIGIESRVNSPMRTLIRDFVRPFDLSAAPLVRAKVAVPEEGKQLLMFDFHHLIADGISLVIWVREFFIFYREEDLPPTSIQYKDYSEWSRARMRGADFRRQAAYWLSLFSSPVPVLDIPTDFPRPKVRSDEGAEILFEWTGDMAERLDRFCSRSRRTKFMFLLGCLSVLLSRLSGLEDIVIGVPVACRGRTQLESVVGMFVNTLAMRTFPAADKTAAIFFKEITVSVLQAFDHKDYPFEELVEQVWGQRDLSRNPLFDVMLVWEEAVPSEIAVPGFKMTPVRFHREVTQFDITLYCREIENGLVIDLNYSTELYSENTAQRFGRYLYMTARGLLEKPEEKLGGISILPDDEKELILGVFNNTAVDYPEEKTIVELFLDQVGKTTDKIASGFRDRVMSFGFLDKTTGSLALLLKGKGIRRNSLVALMLNRSLSMMTAILAILKSSAAYLPLDPGFPEKRVRYLMTDSACGLLIGESGLNMSPPPHCEIITLEDSSTFLNKEDYNQSNETPEPSDPAYMIYTSGSTGKPKGVLIEHRPLVNRILWMQRSYPLDGSDTILQKTPFVFDVSVWELLWWAAAGASLRFLEPGAEKDPAVLFRNLAGYSISTVHFVPSMLSIFMEYLGNRTDLSGLSVLRRVFASGETLDVTVVKTFNQMLGRKYDIQLINLYGPTEATVDVSYYNCPRYREPERIPIGKPIDNIRLFPVDKNLQLVPIGVPAELTISGTGLSRGYINNPELTAHKFVGCSFLDGSDRLYHTGDVACWSQDGNIQFLGRMDHQIKVRGFRIEPGEIESRLLKLDVVRQAVIVSIEMNGNCHLCAYYAADETLSVHRLREFLSGDLPEYMIPSHFVRLSRIPLTANGKVDRGKLPDFREIEPQTVPTAAPLNRTEDTLRELWKSILGVNEVGVNENFFELGGNSFDLIRLSGELERTLKKEIPVTLLFRYPTIRRLARYLDDQESTNDEKAEGDSGELIRPFDIAVIGMSGRFPGADSVEMFWENLCNGIETLSFFSPSELEGGVSDTPLAEDFTEDWVPAKGYLADAGCFDASFFDYTPSEAEKMDPQVRIFHECAWEAMEHAGYAPGSHGGTIGLYAGASSNIRWQTSVLLSTDGGETAHYSVSQLCDKDFLCSRVSYKLDLNGPSLSIQTACSTSLAAVELACRELRNGKCDMALAGGVSVTLPARSGYFYQEGMILAGDGHCRAFDAAAQGTVIGNGIGVMVLKRLEDAEADLDSIDAVVKGAAVNNDGSRRVGYTAPSVEGQAEVIRKALLMSGIDPVDIGYIEAHGTGTLLGDPVEIAALELAFASNKRHFCGIGSVKTNIGHLDAAAGAAGFIKVVLCLKNRLIPPNLHFQRPNPKMNLDQTPFFVVSRLSEWKSRDDHSPLRAGISSFGIGGTNVHVVLQEAPPGQQRRSDRKIYLLLLSARTEAALEKISRNLALYLEQNSEVNLGDVAYTLQVGRRHLGYRNFLICREVKEAAGKLASPPGEVSAVTEGNDKIAFMFPGQGSQYLNMGVGLYRTVSSFRREVDDCFDILKSLTSSDWRSVLYPDMNEASDTGGRGHSDSIDQTHLAQPLLFVIEYALARMLMEWGIKPHAMIGHSIGEYVAAALAGVFSREDALAAVLFRSRLMQKMPPGAMLGVPLTEREVRARIGGKVSLAAVNGPRRCVISGEKEALRSLYKSLKAEGHEVRYLHTSHAFHSEMMRPVLKEFSDYLGQLRLHKPKLPFISNLSGQWITEKEAVDPVYWARQLRETVRFDEGIKNLLKEGISQYIESGPGQTLNSLVIQHPNRDSIRRVVNLLPHPKEKREDFAYLLEKIGRLWSWGGGIEWRRFCRDHGGTNSRVHLPTYPFERRDFGSGVIPIGVLKSGISAGLGERQNNPGRKPGISDWLYLPTWKRVPLPKRQARSDSGGRQIYLALSADDSFSAAVIGELRHHGCEVVTVRPKKKFDRVNDLEFTLDPGRRDNYRMLVSALVKMDKVPHQILHFWNFYENRTRMGLKDLEEVSERGFYCLVFLVQALAGQSILSPMGLTVVTRDLHGVTGEESLDPLPATVLGPIRVIPREYGNFTCTAVDFSSRTNGSDGKDLRVGQLWAEMRAGNNDQIVAYRRRHRWVSHIESCKLENSSPEDSLLKPDGVYMITGGLGGMGLELAEYIVEKAGAKLVLMGRGGLPSRREWRNILTASPNGESARKIEKIQKLENLGGRVLVMKADASDEEQVTSAVNEAENRFGTINGVIHAAGVPDGGLIQARDYRSLEDILSPKVKGTLVLEKVLAGRPLDFFIICSSLSSIMAPLGQAAYAAANAFQDHFAHSRDSGNGSMVVSVNWDTWQQVGMAADRLRKMDHPLFDDLQTVTGEREGKIYISFLEMNHHWFLSEHLYAGEGLVPGTALLEMARAALQDASVKKRPGSGETIHIAEVYFLSPLTVKKAEAKEVHTILQPRGDTIQFTIVSREDPEMNFWHRHAEGTVKFLDHEKAAPGRIDIKKIEAACGEKKVIYSPDDYDELLSKDVIAYGPRWHNIKSVQWGEGCGLAHLELPTNFSSDTRMFHLHPALFDMATSFMMGRLKLTDTYLPFSYQGLRIYAPLPGKIVCFSRLLTDRVEGAEAIEFALSVTDEEGKELVTVDRYVRRRLSKVPGKESHAADHPMTDFLNASPNTPSGWRHIVRKELESAIKPAEGRLIFERILEAPVPQVAVSTRDLAERLCEYRRQNDSFPAINNETGRESPRKELSRSGLNTPYNTWTNDMEKQLIDIWQHFFGLEPVGIDDDFFELGGDSLMAMTLAAGIHKELMVKVPLARFFATPTIRGIAGYILGEGEPQAASYAPVPPTEKREYYPLSSAQQRLFILQQVNPDSVSYNIPEAMQLEGVLDKDRLEESFLRLIQRHESFRTSFEMIGDIPVQRVHTDTPFTIDCQDISGKSFRNGGEENSLDRYIHDMIPDFIRPFELSTHPLLRAVLIKYDHNRHILLLDMHHIITDAISTEMAVDELITLYRGEELEPLILQYKDFSEWWNRLTGEERLKRQESFWMEELKGPLPDTRLSFDFPLSSRVSDAGDSVKVELTEELSSRLNTLASRKETTLFIVLLAAFNILIFKYRGQEDVIIGTDISGRNHADLQRIVGMFVNILAMRNYPVGTKRLDDFLNEVKENSLRAFENQDYQFEDLANRLEVNRTPGRNPLFDIVFSLERPAVGPRLILESVGGPPLEMRPFSLKYKMIKYNLGLFCFQEEGRLTIRFDYATQLFKRMTVEKMADRFIAVLEQVVQGEPLRIRDIEVPHDLITTKSHPLEIDEGNFEFEY